MSPLTERPLAAFTLWPAQTAQLGAHYGKGMCVLMSISCHPPHTHTNTHTLIHSLNLSPKASQPEASRSGQTTKQTGPFLVLH